MSEKYVAEYFAGDGNGHESAMRPGCSPILVFSSDACRSKVITAVPESEEPASLRRGRILTQGQRCYHGA